MLKDNVRYYEFGVILAILYINMSKNVERFLLTICNNAVIIFVVDIYINFYQDFTVNKKLSIKFRSEKLKF